MADPEFAHGISIDPSRRFQAGSTGCWTITLCWLRAILAGIFRTSAGSRPIRILILLAAMTSRTGRVGSVLGMDIPPVRAYEAGYRAGILTVNGLEGKEVDYRSVTVGDFNNPSRAKSLAQGLLGQRADVLLQLAGNSGLGVIEAVRESSPPSWAIGADLDQDDLAPGRILVSILKRIDNAVFEAIRDARAGRLRPGHRWIGIAEGATGLSDMRHTRDHIPERALDID